MNPSTASGHLAWLVPVVITVSASLVAPAAFAADGAAVEYVLQQLR
ncbi:MAG: hypothetical protein JSW68_08905 [Burkholderiales bacterium]|nr:MAG: hypothetical protein JSW68_08905 [Burkholderiales bacterium]